MLELMIVIDLNKPKNHTLSLLDGLKTMLIHILDFECTKETLTSGIVMVISSTTHATVGLLLSLGLFELFFRIIHRGVNNTNRSSREATRWYFSRDCAFVFKRHTA